MEIRTFDEITDKLSSTLNHNRYVHTLGVAFTASALAMKYGYDPDRALLAGLLHDCAKCFETEEKFRLCEEGGVILSRIERNNPALIHAKLGAYIAKRDYGVDDEELLDAIRTHTTGAPAMTLIQKILYIADMIEPNRDDDIPSMPEMRAAAFSDIDECMYIISGHLLEYLRQRKDKEIDPMSQSVYDYYKELHYERKGTC